MVLVQKILIIFAGPQRGRPTPDFSVFIHLFVHIVCSFVCLLRSHFGPNLFIKGQRNKGTKGQRGKREKGQRDKGTKEQKDKGTKGQMNLGTKGT